MTRWTPWFIALCFVLAACSPDRAQNSDRNNSIFNNATNNNTNNATNNATNNGQEDAGNNGQEDVGNNDPPDTDLPDDAADADDPPDLGPLDTDLPDTDPPDTDLPDTDPPDSDPPDLGPPDVGPPDTDLPDVDPTTDDDDDGILNGDDNCPQDPNNGQSDRDNDGVGDACDNCPAHLNTNQSDTDGDGIGDVCDDDDRDGVLNVNDNCPGASNPGQRDTDDDGIGDVCDNCRMTANFSQLDTDGDGIGDACELPGDDDGDTVADADDNCPAVPNFSQSDIDQDGIGDSCDNCPRTANFSQRDTNGDGVGDACQSDQDGDGFTSNDNCPAIFNPQQGDRDSDTVGDACDNCPATPNADQADGNGDGRGDACTAVDTPVPVTLSLAWPGANRDLDLHLVHPNGTWFDEIWSVYWLNQTPIWATPGLVDVTAGGDAPEQIIAQALPPGRYMVGVAYYRNSETTAAVTPTLTVTCDGQTQTVAGPTLTNPTQGNADPNPNTADLWHAVWLDVPSCTLTTANATPTPMTCVGGNNCTCPTCDDGVCFQNTCENQCNPSSGECVDLCSSANCGANAACNPADGICYTANLSLCEPCEFDGQCTGGLCLDNPNVPGERTCSRPCGTPNTTCPADYTCVGVGSAAHCEPDLGTCVDRCAAVTCTGEDVCDPFTGQCRPEVCQLNTQCGANNYCDRQDGMCYTTGGGMLPLGSTCQADADCSVGAICAGLTPTCRSICDTNADCPMNVVCSQDLFFQGRLSCGGGS